LASIPPPQSPQACANCGAQVAPRLLRCPGCGRLVHAATLKRLAEEAEAADLRDDAWTALQRWREALPLVPPDAPQREAIAKRVETLVARAAKQPRPKTGGQAGRWAGIAGIGSAVMLLLSKFKLLALGLLKLPTLLSMLAFFGVYWAAFGWVFAAGIVVSIYIHELGHVFEMKRRGMEVNAPMFVPGLGAFVRLSQHPASDVEDNRIGLAGPIWGLAAALAAFVAWRLTGQPAWGAIARMGAWINLFNLLPVWQLDGSRGFASLMRWQRVVVALAFGAAFAFTRDPLTMIIAVVACIRALSGRAPRSPDHVGFANFLGLVAALSALLAIQVPGAPF
jgi:Zn-dependent protease